jgi:hypothetical protein
MQNQYHETFHVNCIQTVVITHRILSGTSITQQSGTSVVCLIVRLAQACIQMFIAHKPETGADPRGV